MDTSMPHLHIVEHVYTLHAVILLLQWKWIIK